MFFYYLVILGYYNMPDFLISYLNAPSLLRLKKLVIVVEWIMLQKIFISLENI